MTWFGLTVTTGGLAPVLHRAARDAAATCTALCEQIARTYSMRRRIPTVNVAVAITVPRLPWFPLGVCAAGDLRHETGCQPKT